MKKILITDDDPRMVEIIESAFEPFSDEFIVFTANDGKSALEMVQKHHPDLLILDLMMPNGHGYYVCREIREDKTLNEMKILVVSAKYFPRDQHDILKLGADMFMPKPFSLKQIIQESRALLAI
jgi:two-component system, OmpR family, alkaline phosphatase synthesis response regulator PhoP